MSSPPSPHSGCTSPHTSPHISMRHRRFFDIITYMCRPTIELQLRPKVMQFERWIQKLLSCKVARLNRLLDPSCGSRAARPILSMCLWTVTYPKIIFWKIILGPPCVSYIKGAPICTLHTFLRCTLQRPLKFFGPRFRVPFRVQPSSRMQLKSSSTHIESAIW